MVFNKELATALEGDIFADQRDTDQCATYQTDILK
jgi:hypothetical protein